MLLLRACVARGSIPGCVPWWCSRSHPGDAPGRSFAKEDDDDEIEGTAARKRAAATLESH